MSQNERTEFAERLRSLREARGWSQSELADRASISRPTVARAELGVTVPQRSTVHLLAGALGVDPGALLLGVEE